MNKLLFGENILIVLFQSLVEVMTACSTREKEDLGGVEVPYIQIVSLVDRLNQKSPGIILYHFDVGPSVFGTIAAILQIMKLL